MPLYSDPDGIWVDYTPTLNQFGDVACTVTRARYARIGSTIICQGRLEVTGAGMANSPIGVSLPFAPVGYVFDESMGTFSVNTAPSGYALAAGVWGGQFGLTFLYGLDNGGSTYLGQSGSAIATALQSGEVVTWSITYEV